MHLTSCGESLGILGSLSGKYACPRPEGLLSVTDVETAKNSDAVLFAITYGLDASKGHRTPCKQN